MPGIPADTVKFNMLGTLPAGEQFSAGFWVAHHSVGSQTALKTLVDLIVDKWVDHAAERFVEIIPPSAAYTHIRAYSYASGNDGHAQFVAEGNIGTSQGTGTGSTVIPLQTCMVVSLRTDNPGASHRGRMYLPACANIMSTNGFFSNSTCDDVGGAAASFFNSVNDELDGEVAVISQRLATSTAVTQLQVDNRPDIQRRRADKQVPTHVSVNAITT